MNAAGNQSDFFSVPDRIAELLHYFSIGFIPRQCILLFSAAAVLRPAQTARVVQVQNACLPLCTNFSPIDGMIRIAVDFNRAPFPCFNQDAARLRTAGACRCIIIRNARRYLFRFFRVRNDFPFVAIASAARSRERRRCRQEPKKLFARHSGEAAGVEFIRHSGRKFICLRAARSSLGMNLSQTSPVFRLFCHFFISFVSRTKDEGGGNLRLSIADCRLVIENRSLK